MSFTPFFKFPRRSDGLSLQGHYNNIGTVNSLNIPLSITKVLRLFALKLLISMSSCEMSDHLFLWSFLLGAWTKVCKKQGFEHLASVYHVGLALPAELLDEVGSVLCDLLGELHHVNAPQDDVVGLHGVRTREGRARGGREREKERESEGEKSIICDDMI